jgi:hypothetical protein
MDRPTNPFDYTHIDAWFRRVVDPKIFTNKHPPFIGEIDFHETIVGAAVRYEHRYYYLDGVLLAHVVLEQHGNVYLNSHLFFIETLPAMAFKQPEEYKSFLLSYIKTKTEKTSLNFAPNRRTSLTALTANKASLIQKLQS